MPKHIRNGKIVGGAIGIARNLFFDKTKKNLLAAENVQDAVDELSEKVKNNNSGDMALINQTLGYTKKNLLPYPYTNTTKTSGGITYTDNGDGSITLNGTATAENSFFISTRQAGGLKNLKTDIEYLMTGCPSGGSADSYYLSLSKTLSGENDSIGCDYGNGISFSLTEESEEYYGMFIIVKAGVTLDNVTFYPMIRNASIIDDTYEPYVESVNDAISQLKNKHQSDVDALWAAINNITQ